MQGPPVTAGRSMNNATPGRQNLSKTRISGSGGVFVGCQPVRSRAQGGCGRRSAIAGPVLSFGEQSTGRLRLV